jgi:aminocarboxymuconate-semialdehyde decarboxylase
MKAHVIDGHRHLMCMEAHQLANNLDPVKANPVAGVGEESAMVNLQNAPDWIRKMTDFDEHIADMIAADIDMGVIWPPPPGFYYWAESSAGAEMARLVNENTAKHVRLHENRLVGLSSAPLQDTDLATVELEHAIRNLGLNGVAIASNVNGKGLDEERLLPFFEKAQSLDVPIFIHPDSPPGNARLLDYYLVNFVGYPMDSTLAACELVFGGVLDRCPDLKICLVHAGGTLPFLLGRLEHGQSVRPEVHNKCEHPFSYYLKNFYVDTVTFNSEILRFVLRIMPEGHVFMGTDYPFDMADPDPVASAKNAIQNDNALIEQVLGGNLESLLKMRS